MSRPRRPVLIALLALIALAVAVFAAAWLLMPKDWIDQQARLQAARVKGAARKAPLVLSAATGEGVPEVLRALVRVIDEARRSAEPRTAVVGWQP